MRGTRVSETSLEKPWKAAELSRTAWVTSELGRIVTKMLNKFMM